jgi:streptogramin lyase
VRLQASARAVPEDECILHLVKPKGGDARHVSVNPDGDVWVASIFGEATTVFSLIDGTTAEILEEHGPFDCGGYGGLVDANGVVWSASSGPLLRWDPRRGRQPTCIDVGGTGYGLALAPDGHIWHDHLRDQPGPAHHARTALTRTPSPTGTNGRTGPRGRTGRGRVGLLEPQLLLELRR